MNEQVKARLELAEMLKKEMGLPETVDTRPYEIMYEICMKQMKELFEGETGKAKFEDFLMSGREEWANVAGDFKVEIMNPRSREMDVVIYNAENTDGYLFDSTSIKQAIEVITKALREDPDYYYSWQANIAMQFKDLFTYDSLTGSGLLGSRITQKVTINTSEEIHKIANDAAKNFLNLLIK